MMKRHTDRLPARLSTSGARELRSNVLSVTQNKVFKYFHSGSQCSSLPEVSLEPTCLCENVP